MRAHEMTELMGASMSLAMFLLTRRRPAGRAPGEQTGGRRCAALRQSPRERARRGLALPSEWGTHERSPPEM